MNPPLGIGLIHLFFRCPIGTIVGLVVLIILASGYIFFPFLYGPPSDRYNCISCSGDSAITFTFDDGYESAFTEAYPILSKHGYTGVIYVITNSIGQPGYVSINQLKALQVSDWEIGSHTVTHRDLTSLTDEEIRNELLNSKQYLEKQGISVWGLASPNGDYNQKVVNIISDYYLYHRAAWPSGLNDFPITNKSKRYEIGGITVYNDTPKDEVKEWIIKAKKEHKWLVLVFHKIDEPGRYSYKSEDFEEIVKFARESGLKDISTTQAVFLKK
jgi:peptidoglycan/xylan/chitin deacetylase (PgdA/CDA1 family)